MVLKNVWGWKEEEKEAGALWQSGALTIAVGRWAGREQREQCRAPLRAGLLRRAHEHMLVRRGAAAADHTKATRRGECEHRANRDRWREERQVRRRQR